MTHQNLPAVSPVPSRQTLLADATALSDRMTGLRRAIHAEPEVGLHTPKTRDSVRAALAHLPLEWREGPSTSGFVGVLRGGASGGSRSQILLRADMDALPMAEKTGLSFASRVNDTMHACGHDSHSAMLAGAAELLCQHQSRLSGDVMFMFQPGEEGWHGARFMIDDGLLAPLPQAAFALHVMPNMEHGLIAGRAGSLLAAADMIAIHVEGAGGHASMPHLALDPVPVAAEIITALQTMVTRRFRSLDPVVVTITSIKAGTTHNVIADNAELSGTMRSLSASNRQALAEAVRQLVPAIAAAHGLKARVDITEGFPVTHCASEAVDLGEALATSLFGASKFQRLTEPIMGAEDFSYVLEKIPGAMFFLGAAPKGADLSQCPGIHSPRMILDESVMPIGAAFLAGLAMRFLAEGFIPRR